jgi:anti-anti-sigma factor
MHDERTPRYPGDFSFDTVEREGALELILGGEIDMGAAFKLESSFDACLAAGEAQSVVFDLADVTFIDSAGIGSLRSMHERAGQLGIDVSVSRVSEPVQRVLDVAGLSGTIES